MSIGTQTISLSFSVEGGKWNGVMGKGRSRSKYDAEKRKEEKESQQWRVDREM